MVELTHDDLIRAVIAGDLVQLEAWKVAGASLLNDGKNLDADTNFKLIQFMFSGRVKVKLEVLLWLLKDTKFIDPTAHEKELVGEALKYGRVEILDWLESVLGTQAVVNFASILRLKALDNNQPKAVEWVVTKAAEIGYALQGTSFIAEYASLFGHLELLKIILLHYGHDESVSLETLLRNTGEHGFPEIAEWLILYSELNPSSDVYFLEILKMHHKDKNVAKFFDLIHEFISAGVTLKKLRLNPRMVGAVTNAGMSVDALSAFTEEQLQKLQNSKRAGSIGV